MEEQIKELIKKWEGEADGLTQQIVNVRDRDEIFDIGRHKQIKRCISDLKALLP